MKNTPIGFGTQRPPKFWLQAVFAEGTPDKYFPCYGSGAKAKDEAIALLANPAIEYVLLLRGQANPDDITRPIYWQTFKGNGDRAPSEYSEERL